MLRPRRTRDADLVHRRLQFGAHRHGLVEGETVLAGALPHGSCIGFGEAGGERHNRPAAERETDANDRVAAYHPVRRGFNNSKGRFRCH
jgi:hypothetical protein